MAINIAWPISGERKGDWERMIQYYGLCEVLPDRSKPASVEKTFREWAMKRRLAFVEGENLVAFDPKAFNPKDSLDRSRFGFLLRYIRPRDIASFRRDLETAFSVRSMYVLDAIKSYWLMEGVITEVTGMVHADRELLRLMGFSYLDLMQALDGIVKKEYMVQVVSNHQPFSQDLGTDVGGYLVNFDIMKERFFDAEFLLHAAGQPIPLKQLAAQMGVDGADDVRAILREAKKRFDLNVEISEDHVMFGPPSQKSIDALVAREKGTKQKLEQSEGQLRDRLKTIKELLDRYNAREAKIMNEAETLREEGRVVWIKAKMVNAAVGQIGNKKVSR
ncbi:MAG: hypothetical protein HY261_03935 [Chloroflexi bacterium]|nr:hypothetical protein [Chloroflexota bacterium]